MLPLLARRRNQVSSIVLAGFRAGEALATRPDSLASEGFRGFRTHVFEWHAQREARKELPTVSALLPGRSAFVPSFSPHGFSLLPKDLTVKPIQLDAELQSEEPSPSDAEQVEAEPGVMQCVSTMTWRRLKMKKHKIKKRRKLNRHKTKKQ